MPDPIDSLREEISRDGEALRDAASLEVFRLKHLGSNGSLKKLMGLLKEAPADQKREFGRRANELKNWAQQQFDERKGSLGGAAKPQASGGPGEPGVPGVPGIDVTEPGLPPRMGRAHVITQTIDELIDVFGRMGFDVATGPEVEDEFHNFVALNIPESHPARDPLDNFYLEGGGKGARLQMLRSQTSTIQIRVMEKTRPPLRVVAMGRVYRPDEHDATHYSMFHQVEGLYVDRKVTMADLKTTLLQFAEAYWGKEAEVRLRPSFFPFTEPSAEFDVKMNIAGQWQWKEIGGCGMVDPAVFEAVGYDPEEWTGFAFGLGIERLAMRKYGITDIRWMFENDVRFLRQF